MIRFISARIHWLSAGLIALTALIHFHPSLQNDFSLDDTYYLQQIENIQSWKDVLNVTQLGFSYVDYRPLPSITFAVEKMLSGGTLQPKTAHAVNLALYILCAWVLYFFVYRLGKLFHYTSNVNWLISLVSALIFVSLPLHTSMVANIKSRDGLLSFLLGLTFLYGIFILFTEKRTLIRLSWLAVALLAITGATYSKLDGLNFVLAVPLLLFLTYRQIEWKQIARLAFIGILSYRLFSILFFSWMDQKSKLPDAPETLPEDPLFYTENPIVAYDDIPTRLAFGVQTIFEYLLMVFKPIRHYFYYGFDMIPVLPLSSPVILMKLLIIVLSVALCILMYIRQQQMTAFGIAFFFTSLLYCSNIYLPVSGIVADRYAFIASAGACIAFSGMLFWVCSKITAYFKTRFQPEPVAVADTKSAKSKKIISAVTETPWYQQPVKITLFVTTFICLFYLPFNISRSKEWKNYFTLFEADMPQISHRSYEANRIAIKNYVETAIDSDDPDFRQQYFTKALEYGINAISLYDSGQYVHDGMILALRGMNQFDATLAKAREVIARFDSSEVAWRVLTDYYYYKKYLDSAAYGYRKLIDIVPNDPNVYFFYVTALQENGQMNEGLAFCDSLIAVNKASYIPYQAKSYLYLNVKDSANAVIQIEKGFEMGWRDSKMLDVMGMYWWTRDMKKWEEMKKYLN